MADKPLEELMTEHSDTTEKVPVEQVKPQQGKEEKSLDELAQEHSSIDFDEINFADLVNMPPERRQELKDLGIVGFWENAGRNISSLAGDTFRFLELAGTGPDSALAKQSRAALEGGPDVEPLFGIEALKSPTFSMERIRRAMNRLQKGQYQERPEQESLDQQIIEDYVTKLAEEQIRGVSIGGKIGAGVVALPEFVLAFFATGGLASVFKKAGTEGLEAVVKKGLKNRLQDLASRGLRTAAGAGARTAALPHFTARNFVNRRVNSYRFELTEKGIGIAQGNTEEQFTSFSKALGDTFIEFFSEAAGGVVGKAVPAFMPKGVKKTFERAYKKLHPSAKVGALWTKAGYNGFIEELEEEQLADLWRAALNIEDFGAENPDQFFDRLGAAIHGWEELAVNAGIIAFPAGAKLTTNQAVRLIQRRKRESGFVEPEDFEEGASDRQIEEILGVEEAVTEEVVPEEAVAEVEEAPVPEEQGPPQERVARETLSTVQEQLETTEEIAPQELDSIKQTLINTVESLELTEARTQKLLDPVTQATTQAELAQQVPVIQQGLTEIRQAATKRQAVQDFEKATEVVEPKEIPPGKRQPDFDPIETEGQLLTISRISQLSKKDAASEAKVIESFIKEKAEAGEEISEFDLARLDLLRNFSDIKSRSTKEIQDLTRRVKNLKKFGEKVEKDINDTVEVVQGDKPLDPKSKQKFDKIRQVKNTILSGSTDFVGWEDLMDLFSKDEGSSKAFDSRLSKLARVREVEQQEKSDSAEDSQRVVNDMKEAFGLRTERQAIRQIRRDGKKVFLGNFLDATEQEIRLELTKSEMRKIIMELRDESIAESIRSEKGGYQVGTKQINGFTAEMEQAVREQLDTHDLAFIDAQFKFYEEHYEKVNKVYKEEFGTDLPRVEFFSPISRVVSKDIGAESFFSERRYRSLIERVENFEKIQVRSDTEALQFYLNEMNHYINWSRKLRELGTVFGNKEVRRVIGGKFGAKALKNVDQFIKDFKTRGIDRARFNSALATKIRTNFTVSVLALKPALTVKQMASFLAYAEFVPTTAFITGTLDFMKNPVGNAKLLTELSPLLKTRGSNITRDIQDALQSREFGLFTKNPSWKNLMLVTTRIGDKGAIALGGWSVYKHTLKKTGSQQKAIEAFEAATAATQQSSDISQLSAWQRGGSFAKLFTMFTSAQNQYMRREMAAIRNLLKGRITKAEFAKKFVIYHFALPVFFQWLSDFGNWDEEEQMRAMVLGSFNGWFIASDFLDWAVRLGIDSFEDFDIKTHDPDLSPTFGLEKELERAIGQVDFNDIQTEDVIEAVQDLTVNVAGPLTGLPIKRVLDAWEGAEDITEGETGKGALKLAGWSPYTVESQLKDDEKKEKKTRPKRRTRRAPGRRSRQ